MLQQIQEHRGVHEDGVQLFAEQLMRKIHFLLDVTPSVDESKPDTSREALAGRRSDTISLLATNRFQSSAQFPLRSVPPEPATLAPFGTARNPPSVRGRDSRMSRLNSSGEDFPHGLVSTLGKRKRFNEVSSRPYSTLLPLSRSTSVDSLGSIDFLKARPQKQLKRGVKLTFISHRMGTGTKNEREGRKDTAGYIRQMEGVPREDNSALGY